MRVPRTPVAAVLLVLAACNSDHSRSQSPTSPPPQSSVAASYFLNLDQESGTRSLEVQFLVDDVVLYSGPLFTGSPWDYHVDPLYLSGNLGELEGGRHTLTLKVTRQESSPETYRVTANVEVGAQQLAAWDESVTLVTGEAWLGEFVLDDGTGTWDY